MLLRAQKRPNTLKFNLRLIDSPWRSRRHQSRRRRGRATRIEGGYKLDFRGEAWAVLGGAAGDDLFLLLVLLVLVFPFLFLLLLCLCVFLPCEAQPACVCLTEPSPSPPVMVKVKVTVLEAGSDMLLVEGMHNVSSSRTQGVHGQSVKKDGKTQSYDTQR